MSLNYRILITGGAGYLGSTLVPHLLRKGCSVTVLDNLMYRQAPLLECCADENFQFVYGDCRDERVVAGLAKDKDFIIPLAALVGAPRCARDKVGAVTINRDAIRMLCSVTSKSQGILYPTTNSGYGIGQDNVYCTEETPLKPISLYGETKVEAEDAVLQRGNGLTFRLATVFGTSPRMRLDLLINDFVNRAIKDRFLVVFEGHFKRNYLHIRDVARAFEHSIENFGTMKELPYNVGLNDANLSKLELCEEIKKQIPEFVVFEAPIGEDPDKRNYIVSNDRILATGFRTEWGLERGIRELIKGFAILGVNHRFTNI